MGFELWRNVTLHLLTLLATYKLMMASHPAS